MLGIKIKCMVVLLNLVLNIPQSLLILLCTTGLEIKKIFPSQCARNSSNLVASSKILVAKVANPNKI